MAKILMYADESGNFDFSNKGTEFFMLTTVTTPDHACGDDLLALRRDLAWRGIEQRRPFHAGDDPSPLRQVVFKQILQHDFRVDVTIMRKRRTQPHVRPNDMRFYQHAWFYHMKCVVPRVATAGDELLVIAASIGEKKKGQAFYAGIKDVMQQTALKVSFKTGFWDYAVDPCLQVADYCCWAVKRKWEDGDTKWYEQIKGKVKSEFDVFRYGTTDYY